MNITVKYLKTKWKKERAKWKMEKENKRSRLVDVKVREEVEVENKWKKEVETR